MLHTIVRGPATRRHHGAAGRGIRWCRASTSLAGLEASLSADLLPSRRIRTTGSGAGSRSAEEMLVEAPEVMARFADGSPQLPRTAFPLSRVGEAWAHTGPQPRRRRAGSSRPFIRT
ncbi:hypothetical protein [Streptomyces sp. B3I8]|uniref:hypothetical protein n=1 Tax=Streptomyces sp. B3I8 TaxID=3042303 RepID=UPI00277E6B0F|nr:hypothetical protein [Streptomyces sp. B3I8]MDQ0784921.1 hypothetical protein [Streptomyces sp. B3I8]